jgi:polysaccharide pyruvyl transferase WcaK-like protein
LNFVREPASLATCQGAGWSTFGLIPDAAFFYTPRQQPKSATPKRRYFCITGSAHLQSYDLQAYALGIHAIAKRWGLLPVFLYSRKSDSAVSKAYSRICDTDFLTITSESHPDVDQVLPMLAGAEVVIGGRYHTSISALSQGTPVILTASNSHKSQGLETMLGQQNIAFVPSPNVESFSAAMEPIMTEGAVLRSRIVQAVERLSDEAQSASVALKDLLASHAKDASPSNRTTEPDPQLPELNKRARLLRPIFRDLNLASYDRTGFQKDEA